ncbi:MAG: type II toxin-antitoxin system RelE/ParE family toxin [Chloroflexia bacterium]|nr:type II toxin-antitoxin system RelE/ParE family toxin [Chloroflexia bacterium]
MYRVEVSPRAERDLKKLHRQNRQAYGREVPAIRRLADDPRPQGCKPLSGQPAWRIRIGDHRVIYAVADMELTVTILGVAHRRDVYRRRTLG